MEKENGKTRLRTWITRPLKQYEGKKRDVLMPVECAIEGCNQLRTAYDSYCLKHRLQYNRMWKKLRKSQRLPYKYDVRDKFWVMSKKGEGVKDYD